MIISESLFSNVSGLTICLASSFFMCKFSFILSTLSWDCFCPNELLMWIRPWHYIPDLQSHNSQSISVTVIRHQPWFHTVPKCSQFWCPSRDVIILINEKKLQVFISFTIRFRQEKGGQSYLKIEFYVRSKVTNLYVFFPKDDHKRFES